MVNQTNATERARINEITKRERSKKHMTRWEDYRKMKMIVVERYVKAKKRQRTAEEWQSLMRLGLHMKVLFRKREELRAWKIWKMEMSFVAVMLTAKLRVRLRYQGGI